MSRRCIRKYLLVNKPVKAVRMTQQTKWEKTGWISNLPAAFPAFSSPASKTSTNTMTPDLCSTLKKSCRPGIQYLQCVMLVDKDRHKEISSKQHYKYMVKSHLFASPYRDIGPGNIMLLTSFFMSMTNMYGCTNTTRMN